MVEETNKSNLTEIEQPSGPSEEDIQRLGWMAFANCKNKTTEMFPQSHKDISYILNARAICSECSVSKQCLEYALEFPAADMHGVWAGHTSRQLSAEQKRRGVGPIRPTLAQMWGMKTK